MGLGKFATRHRVREFEAVALVHLDAIYQTALRLTGPARRVM